MPTGPPPPLIAPQPGPASLKEARWAGHRLGPLRGAPERRIAESWEFSTMPGSTSRARGRELTEVLGQPLHFLAKLIDTAGALSIQVHPTDNLRTGAPGKEEAWIIVDAEPGATLLAGTARGVDHEALRAAMRTAIADPTRSAVLIDCLQSIAVQRGTVIVVPAGTVHAIGPGIMLAEIQQPVDCTYRLFDYGSDRPIHPEQAAGAWRIDARPEIWQPGDSPRELHGRHVSLRVHTGPTATIDPDGAPQLLVAVGGDIALQVESAPDGEGMRLHHGDLALHTRRTVHATLGADAVMVVGRVRP